MVNFRILRYISSDDGGWGGGGLEGLSDATLYSRRARNHVLQAARQLPITIQRTLKNKFYFRPTRMHDTH